MTLSPKLGVVGISTLWHFRLPLPIQMFIKVASSPRLSGIGMPSPILWSHPLKMQRIVLLSSLLWWELGTNSLITAPGEWLSFRRFTSKLSWSWSWLQIRLVWNCSAFYYLLQMGRVWNCSVCFTALQIYVCCEFYHFSQFMQIKEFWIVPFVPLHWMFMMVLIFVAFLCPLQIRAVGIVPFVPLLQVYEVMNLTAAVQIYDGCEIYRFSPFATNKVNQLVCYKLHECLWLWNGVTWHKMYSLVAVKLLSFVIYLPERITAFCWEQLEPDINR